jgi:outer membrane translocation and assembly module TamA
MRGIPVARFQGQSVAAVEAEIRYDVTDRWSLVGFAGTGAAWGSGVSFDDAQRPVSVGAGFRYLIARRLGLYVGMDFARSTADRAFYITVGNAWR